MKKLNLLLSLLFSIISLNISAHDFEAVNSDGKTIYYNVISSANLTVEVTYKGNYFSEYNEYAGEIIIPLSVTYNGETYSVTSLGNYAFAYCSGLTSVTIPNSVTSIVNYAFYNCSSLTSLTIGNSVTSIGDGAFFWCSSLTSVTIPNSVTSIGSSAFSNCSGLTSVTIPNSVTSIGSSAFSNCSGLTSVTIGNSVTSIGEGAFLGCSGLTTIIVDEGNSKYDSREDCNAIIESETNTLISGCKSTIIPNSVTSIGVYAFSGCSGLTSVTIPNSVTLIDDYAFSGCSSLTSVTIPNSVTSIGEVAFEGCSGLTSITIGDGVTSIGFLAFYGCSGLTEIYSLSSDPAVCGRSTFSAVDKTIPVYIPYGSMSAYKSASEWKDFKNFIESEFTGVEEEEISTSDIKVISGNGIEVSDYYGRIRIVNLAGQVVKEAYVNGSIQISLPKGIYIVVTENNSQKVVL